jgi:hypothetical protein
MVTHWAQQWLAFAHDGTLVVLHGEAAGGITHALLELHLLQPCPALSEVVPPSDV